MSSFVKADSGKLRFALVPPKAIEALVRVLTFGAKKYAAHNWVKCPEWSRYVEALDRHLNAWKAGEDNDPETGESHLAHAMCCVVFLMEMQRLGVGKDDRVTDELLRSTAEAARAVDVLEKPAPFKAPERPLETPRPCPDGKHGVLDAFGDCKACGYHVGRVKP